MNTLIRKIEPADDTAIAKVIRQVLIEHNVPKVGTAYADASLDCMYKTYNQKSSVYFVVEQEGTIIGGAGIAPLENGAVDTCELQKMYFLEEARGFGIGAKMMERCLESARNFGFANCYLETMPYMLAAQKLYKKYGFEYLDAPMGNTGHSSCPVWMLKKLAND
ncbi:GNAT family N-acetyltransferase [Flavobacterium salilacus subsp. salilacus]|uniref:GNAT family N-acetyltransferase n=1 Tax=Flavobacterium TaxID=237 RepID=UPI0010751C11|nr:MULTISPECIES: GNAT family N-acetyltransferase [Flavobacterium]KAF2519376.1 GNAT family N-acetyltransferase [Flavobacterium salilacus subsp. salilacus]MBE1614732.1 GNAT family N-acetyltransferase [Flavobacterium sp. SaA2.13]